MIDKHIQLLYYGDIMQLSSVIAIVNFSDAMKIQDHLTRSWNRVSDTQVTVIACSYNKVVLFNVSDAYM